MRKACSKYNKEEALRPLLYDGRTNDAYEPVLPDRKHVAATPAQLQTLSSPSYVENERSFNLPVPQGKNVSS